MSKIALVLLAAMAIVASGCGGDRTAEQQGYERPGDAARQEEATPDRTNTDPTNTAVNERDRTDAYPTPDDQMANVRDTNLTKSIRQEIMADESLSMAAQTVKIITVNGHVTLRGPVKTAAEKATVAAKAEQFAGATHVDNQLEIATD